MARSRRLGRAREILAFLGKKLENIGKSGFPMGYPLFPSVGKRASTFSSVGKSGLTTGGKSGLETTATIANSGSP